MKSIFLIALLGLLPVFFLVSCGGSGGKDDMAVLFPSVGGESYMRNAINTERKIQGRNQLIRLPRLDAVALRECQRAARSGELEVNLTGIQKALGERELVGALLGRLKNRGPETGAKFVPYWKEGPNNREMLLGDWTSFGIGTVPSQDGDMVAVVIFTK